MNRWLKKVKTTVTAERRLTWLLLIPIVLVLIAYVIYPSFRTMIESFRIGENWTLANYGKFFDLDHPDNLEALWNSIKISLLTVILSACVGVPLAFIFTRYDFPGRTLFSTIAIMPIVLPSLVGVLAFLLLYGESGLVTRWIQDLFQLSEPPFRLNGISGILLVHTYTEYVYFYVTVSAALRGLNPSLEEAARSLGAKPFTVFRKVTLPMLTPSLIAGTLLVFMTSMASFSAPFLLAGGYRVLSLQIYYSKLNGDLAQAASQSVVLSIISILFLLLTRWYQNRREYYLTEKGVSYQRTEIKNGWIKWTFVSIGVLGVVILLLPHLTLILLSFVPDGSWTYQPYPTQFSFLNYQLLLQDPHIWEPVRNSLWMATLATLANCVFGLLAAYVLVKRKFRGKAFLDILVMIPWALPATVVAMNLIFAFNQPNIFGFGQVLVGTIWILPLAYFIRHIPLVVRSVSASLEQLDDSLEEASRNLGASWFTTFRRIMIPVIAPGVLAGSLLAFVTSVGEFVSSVLLYTVSNRPISIEIMQNLRLFNIGQASAYAVYQIILIAFVLFLSQKVLGVKTENSLY